MRILGQLRGIEVEVALRLGQDLVVHSANDLRIPVTQGLAAFTALQRRGIPSEFLYFPDENHWILKPNNSLLWHETVLGWLDRWLKPAADK